MLHKDSQRQEAFSGPGDVDANHPLRRLRHRGSKKLTAEQMAHRQKVYDRIACARPGAWLWTGQAKTARGAKYPQIVHSLGGGVTQLVNARHVIFYLATGWVPDDVQQYRAKDGNPLNVHPANLAPMPPVSRARPTNNFWDTERLREYYG